MVEETSNDEFLDKNGVKKLWKKAKEASGSSEMKIPVVSGFSLSSSSNTLFLTNYNVDDFDKFYGKTYPVPVIVDVPEAMSYAMCELRLGGQVNGVSKSKTYKMGNQNEYHPSRIPLVSGIVRKGLNLFFVDDDYFYVAVPVKDQSTIIIPTSVSGASFMTNMKMLPRLEGGDVVYVQNSLSSTSTGSAYISLMMKAADGSQINESYRIKVNGTYMTGKTFVPGTYIGVVRGSEIWLK